MWTGIDAGPRVLESRLLAGRGGRGRAAFERVAFKGFARPWVARRRIQTRVNGKVGPSPPRLAGAGGGAWAAPPRPPPSPPRRAPPPSMAWRGWPAPCLWVASCGLLLVLLLLLSPRSRRARRTLRGLFMARSKQLLFRIGLVRGAWDAALGKARSRGLAGGGRGRLGG